MIAPIPESPPRCLAESTPGDLLQVRLIVFELVRSRCWGLPLREGDLLRFVEAGEDAVTVARLDGSRLTVPNECARFIGVRTLSAGQGSTLAGNEVNGNASRIRDRVPDGGRSSSS